MYSGDIKSSHNTHDTWTFLATYSKCIYFYLGNTNTCVIKSILYNKKHREYVCQRETPDWNKEKVTELETKHAV